MMRRSAAIILIIAGIWSCRSLEIPSNNLLQKEPVKEEKKNAVTGLIKEPEYIEQDDTLFKESIELYDAEMYAKALDTLRKMRIEFPESRLREESLFLSAQISMKMDEPYRARYFLSEIIDTGLDEELVFKSSIFLGSILYSEKFFDEAYRVYYRAIKNMSPEYKDDYTHSLAKAYVSLAEYAYYEMHDSELARNYLSSLTREALLSEDLEKFNALKKQLKWQHLSTKDLGISDGNISALTVDGDDLWIGTWNGGAVRYSLSNKETTHFLEEENRLFATTVRTIEATERRIWVGSYQGLYYYSKATSNWYQIERFSNPRPVKVQDIQGAKETIFIGTLGDGLWRLDGRDWHKVAEKELPGDFINCLEIVEDRLFIGTMTMGVFIHDLESRRMFNFEDINGDMPSKNIIMILYEQPDFVWFGTYGEGLYRWHLTRNEIEHFTQEQGHIGDDWVLCGVAAQSGLYFGTFGGGVAVYDKEKDQWHSYNLDDGLTALDISAMAYSSPFLFFGTLGAGISMLHEKS